MHRHLLEAVRSFEFARRAVEVCAKEPNLNRFDFLGAEVSNLSTLTNREGMEYAPVIN